MRPIFIIGCDRSGTTMLADKLGTSVEAVCLPESQFIHENAGNDAPAEQVSGQFQRHFRYRAWREAGSLPPNLSGVSTYAGLVEAFVNRYAAAVGKQASAFIEHSPDNLFHVDALVNAFSGCKFIHIVRDGRAVAASILPLDFGPYDIISAASFWSGRIALGLAVERKYPDRVMTVRYEDVVHGDALKSAFEFAELTPGSGEGLRVPNYAKKTHSLIGNDLDTSRIEAWRDVLTPRQIEIFEAEIGALGGYLGYSRMASSVASGGERLACAAKGYWGRFYGKIRHRIRHKMLFTRVASPGRISKTPFLPSSDKAYFR